MPSGKSRISAAPATAPTLPKRLKPMIHSSIPSAPGNHDSKVLQYPRRDGTAMTGGDQLSWLLARLLPSIDE
jgi:hypothetical protein